MGYIISRSKRIVSTVNWYFLMPLHLLQIRYREFGKPYVEVCREAKAEVQTHVHV